MLDYEKGIYPVAMATSLSFERLTNQGVLAETSPMTTEEKQALDECNHILFNLRTLYRSIYSAVDTTMYEPSPEELAELLANEIDNIILLFNNTLELNLKPVFYHMTYDSLATYLPYCRVRKLGTELQIRRQQQELETYKKLPQTAIDLIDEYDCEFKHDYGKCLMFTHMPVDLLQRKRFSELYLLESNTGRIKSREKWSAKLVNKKEQAAFLPFNAMTVTIFGDGNKLIKAYGPASKAEVLNIAQRNNWNPITGRDRVIDTLDRERDVPFADLLKKSMLY